MYIPFRPSLPPRSSHPSASHLRIRAVEDVHKRRTFTRASRRPRPLPALAAVQKKLKDSTGDQRHDTVVTATVIAFFRPVGVVRLVSSSTPLHAILFIPFLHVFRFLSHLYLLSRYFTSKMKKLNGIFCILSIYVSIANKFMYLYVNCKYVYM